MRVINLSTGSTKKEEPKKKETAAAILSILSVQPQGLTPLYATLACKMKAGKLMTEGVS